MALRKRIAKHKITFYYAKETTKMDKNNSKKRKTSIYN